MEKKAQASSLFKKAHAMTKATIRQGEAYSVVFGQCLKLVKAQEAALSLAKPVAESQRSSFDVEDIPLCLFGSAFISALSYILLLAIGAASVAKWIDATSMQYYCIGASVAFFAVLFYGLHTMIDSLTITRKCRQGSALVAGMAQ